ncbi:hypothetical protein [Reyranella sp.]|uniref:hypothetical protein n=1 Tax=Reyranella sp. TaxID=1929291 RepID=UPI003BAB3754
MDADNLKLECLKLAAAMERLCSADKIVKEAEAYWLWLIAPRDSGPALPLDDTPSTS